MPVLLALCVSFFTLTATIDAQLSVPPSEDIHNHGSYRIKDCGPLWTNVSDSLTLLQSSILPQVLKDLSLASPSPAYKTFFKDITYAPFVNSILTDLVLGRPVSPSGGMQAVAPLIWCVPKPGLLTYNFGGAKRDQYNECVRRPKTAAVSLMGTGIIALCPYFWNLAQVPTKPNCLHVNTAKNEFQRSIRSAKADRAFLDYQIYALMHEINHFYLYAVSQSMVDKYGANECVGLSAQESSENARNYDYYVANIRSECRSFPTVDQSNGRELLSTDDTNGLRNHTDELFNATDIVVNPQMVPYPTATLPFPSAAPLASTATAAPATFDSSELTA